MKTKLFMLAAALLINQAAAAHAPGTRRALAAADTSVKAAPSIADVLPICAKALDAAFDGRDAKAVVEDAVKALPEDQQKAVLAVCGVYLAGAIDAVKHMHSAPNLPAGGTSI